MKKILVIVITILIQGCFQPNYSPEISGRVKRVENNLAGWVQINGQPNWNIIDRMHYYNIKGLSIAIINDFKIEWAKGYGWADTLERRKVNTTTLFQAASIGKSIHAAMVLKLAEEGKLDLTRDINTYLNRWQFPYDSLSGRRIINTIDLLSHTAGLSVHGFDGYKYGQNLPDLVQILDGKEPANSPPVRSQFEPELRFQYSGGGYEISELMVEDITGAQYVDLVKREIFDPLKMNNTFYQSSLPNGYKDLATAYRFDQKEIGCKYHLYPENACGAGLWTTPTDFAKFIVELQLSIQNKSNMIFSNASIKEMLTPRIDNFNGLGVFIDKRKNKLWFHHSGLNEGFTSDYYASVEDGKGVVIMANTDYSSLIDITEEITNSVAQVYNWDGFYEPVIKNEVQVPLDILKTYTGKYIFREDLDQNVRIFLRDGILWFHDSSSPIPWRIHFSTPTDFFFYEIADNNHVFTKNNLGNIDGFIIQTPDDQFKVKKVEKF